MSIAEGGLHGYTIYFPPTLDIKTNEAELKGWLIATKRRQKGGIPPGPLLSRLFTVPKSHCKQLLCIYINQHNLK